MKIHRVAIIAFLFLSPCILASEQRVWRIIGDDINSKFITYRKGNIGAYQALRPRKWEPIIERDIVPGKHIASEYDSWPNPTEVLKCHWETDEATKIYNQLEAEFNAQEKRDRKLAMQSCLGKTAIGVGLLGLVLCLLIGCPSNGGDLGYVPIV
jgi:hypothetical protein